MLQGCYHHNVDEKGRLIVPTKLRTELGDSYVICKGMDGCLYIYPQSEWSAFVKELNKLPLTSPDARKIKRHFVGSATDGSFDKQGRLSISGPLREMAKIEKEVVLLGTEDKIELWAKEKYEESTADVDIDQAMNALSDLGITLSY